MVRHRGPSQPAAFRRAMTGIPGRRAIRTRIHGIEWGLALRKAAGWLGPRWRTIRALPEPWNDPQALAEMSSVLGYSASALAPDFMRSATLAATRRRERFSSLDDELMQDDPDMKAAVSRIRDEARSRPLRFR